MALDGLEPPCGACTSSETELLPDNLQAMHIWQSCDIHARDFVGMAGRKLADMSRRMGYEIREIEDSRYGSVEAYHTDVIEAFRHVLKTDRNMLWKYRHRCAA